MYSKKNQKRCVWICQSDPTPVVDIVMPAYNHEKFIDQAIRSILMQKTKYSYKIHIGEDCSTDGTRKILLDFYNDNPDKIELCLWKKNVGGPNNVLELVKRCRGKYIAYLEGDDYWTDSLKLEKQISFLESHMEYIGTVHNVRCVDKNGILLHLDFGLYPILEEHIYNERQASRFEMASQTASLIHRNIWKEMREKELEDFFAYKGNGDVKIQMFLGLLGDIYYFRDIMADHRRVFQGDSWTARSNSKNMLWHHYKIYKDIQAYLQMRRGISLSIENVFDFSFEESFERVLGTFTKENLDVYWKFLKRKILKIFRE